MKSHLTAEDIQVPPLLLSIRPFPALRMMGVDCSPILALPCSPQVVHLDNMKEPEEEIQKLPPQPPYYDMAAKEPTPHSDKMVRTGMKAGQGPTVATA